MAKFTENTTKVLGNLEKKLMQNNGGKGFFVGEKVHKNINTFFNLSIYSFLYDIHPFHQFVTNRKQL